MRFSELEKYSITFILCAFKYHNCKTAYYRGTNIGQLSEEVDKLVTIKINGIVAIKIIAVDLGNDPDGPKKMARKADKINFI